METWQKQLKLEAIKSYMRGEVALMVGEIISEYILTDKINPLIINKSVDRIMDNINRWEKSDEEIYDNE
ncbi:MAG: hypothetical protein PVJ67_04420, partial [Candidatus Pacearchaeota archaeon]